MNHYPRDYVRHHLRHAMCELLIGKRKTKQENKAQVIMDYGQGEDELQLVTRV